jgi:hypothetical protein
MEYYINKNVDDITYLSELIPLLAFARKQGGLIRTYNLLALCARKLCAH